MRTFSKLKLFLNISDIYRYEILCSVHMSETGFETCICLPTKGHAKIPTVTRMSVILVIDVGRGGRRGGGKPPQLFERGGGNIPFFPSISM